MAQTLDSQASSQHPSALKKALRAVRRSSWFEELVQYSLYYRWVLAGRPAGVPSPHVQKRRQLLNFQAKYRISNLVETGTYFGAMVEAMKSRFAQVYSIEYSPELFVKAKQRFAQDTNVKLFQGDSAVCLKEIVPQLSSPAIFWLDAHFSGGVTAKADLETPIVEEIRTILSDGKDHILVIDDARCFDGTHDYPTVETIKQLILSLRPTYRVYVKFDAILAEPNA